jgi:hypothetical protein
MRIVLLPFIYRIEAIWANIHEAWSKVHSFERVRWSCSRPGNRTKRPLVVDFNLFATFDDVKVAGSNQLNAGSDEDRGSSTGLREMSIIPTSDMQLYDSTSTSIVHLK